MKSLKVDLQQNMQQERFRDVAASFLNETKALHLEGGLVDLLISIDNRYKAEIERLNHIIITIQTNR